MLCHCRTISSQSLFRDWLCFFCQIAKTGEWKGRNFEVWYHLLPRSCFLFHMLLLLLFMYMFGCSDGLSVSFNICRHSFEHSKNLSTVSLLLSRICAGYSVLISKWNYNLTGLYLENIFIILYNILNYSIRNILHS